MKLAGGAVPVELTSRSKAEEPCSSKASDPRTESAVRNWKRAMLKRAQASLFRINYDLLEKRIRKRTRNPNPKSNQCQKDLQGSGASINRIYQFVSSWTGGAGEAR